MGAPMWNLLFGKPLGHISEMSGCFSTVVYGFLYNQKMLHHLHTHHGWYLDPTLASWFTAFSSELRSRWLRSADLSVKSEEGQRGTLVLWSHGRMPAYMWDFAWDEAARLNTSTYIPVIRFDNSKSGVLEQARTIMNSRGIISLEGSAFALEVFLPPRSLNLIVNIPLQAKSRPRNRLPETWHETTAIHLGHTAVDWRFCGTEADFGQRAPVVLQKLLHLGAEAQRRNEALTCV